MVNERVEVVAKCSMSVKNKSVYIVLVEKMCKRNNVRNQEVLEDYINMSFLEIGLGDMNCV